MKNYSKITFSKDPGMYVRPDVEVKIRHHADLDTYFPSNVVKREVWGAKRWNKINFKLMVICDVAFTRTGHEPCYKEEDCTRIVREMQEEHLSQGFEDIKYNFIIGDDGKIYEGRGWLHRGEGIPNVPELEEAEEQVLHVVLISKTGDDGKIYEGRGWLHRGEGIPDVPELEEAEEQVLHVGLISKTGMPYDEQVSMVKQLMRLGMNKTTLYFNYGLYLPE